MRYCINCRTSWTLQGTGMKTAVFLNVTSCSLVEDCRRFTGYCNKPARRHIPQGFVVTAEIASNITSNKTVFIA